MTRKEFARIKAIEKANKERILKVCPDVPDRSGIYILTREENGFRFAYVGQAKKLLTRLAQHLKGYQHIDLSLKKHGLYSEDNLSGWNVAYIECHESCLDDWEQSYVRTYANNGYQMRNKTSGSQSEGKKDIADEPTKGYLEGLHNGYKKAQKEIAHLFKLHLNCEAKKNPPTKLQEKALLKFEKFIGEIEDGQTERKIKADA
jgi:hypothetical protein